MIEVKIESIRMSLMNPHHVIILREIDGARCLPVFVGKPEGDSIRFKLNHDEIPRPLSHDLAADILEQLDARVSHVVIRELRDQHFHAAIVFQGDSGDIDVDCRPSDGLAIAVRVSCPIFVDEDVMSAAGVLPPNATAGNDDIDAFSDFIGSLDMGDIDNTHGDGDDEDKSGDNAGPKPA
jgi:uncharacterized protein